MVKLDCICISQADGDKSTFLHDSILSWSCANFSEDVTTDACPKVKARRENSLQTYCRSYVAARIDYRRVRCIEPTCL